MKKWISLCLSLILALSLAVPAAASAAPAVPAGVSVQVNGENVTFPDASPAVINGRTMVPMRAVLEALGATVDYDVDTRTVTATLDDTQLTHVIGTDVITLSPRKLTADSLTAGGEKLTMDTVSTVKNGSTLVPLRFFSQALGYEVYWDEGAHTAVVIDKEALIEEIDKSFTILNGLQAKQNQALDGNMAIDMDFSGKAKVLDSINGDKTLPFSMKMSALYGAEAMNIEGVMDLSALSALMEGEDPETAKVMEPLLKDLSFQMIYGESMWMQMPALTSMLVQEGTEVPESGVWLKTADAPALSTMGMNAGSSTIGSTLYAIAEAADAEVPVNIYEDLTKTAQLMTGLMGDDTFTKTGEDYSWKLDKAKSAQLAEALGASADSFPFTMEMTVKADGSSTFSMALSIEEDPVAVSMSLSGTSTQTDSTVKGQFQVKNVCDVTFQGAAKVSPSDQAPVTAPPADAVIVDLNDYDSAPLAGADLGIIGGADGPTAIFVTAA